MKRFLIMQLTVSTFLFSLLPHFCSSIVSMPFILISSFFPFCRSELACVCHFIKFHFSCSALLMIVYLFESLSTLIVLSLIIFHLLCHFELTFPRMMLLTAFFQLDFSVEHSLRHTYAQWKGKMISSKKIWSGKIIKEEFTFCEEAQSSTCYRLSVKWWYKAHDAYPCDIWTLKFVMRKHNMFGCK